MLPGKLDEWEDEISSMDITLATTMTRRKSIRRSMVPPDHFGSPVCYNSPKIAVQRKSIGAFMGDASESPVRSSMRSHSFSFLDSKILRQEFPPASQPTHSTPQSAVDALCIPASSPKTEVLPEMGPSTHSHFPNSPPKAPGPTASPESNGCPPYCKTVDDLMNKYRQELNEWPKFLAGLEEKANGPFQPSLSEDQITNDPILRPFVEFILPDRCSSPSVEELQRRTKRAYSKIMVGLVRAKMSQEKLQCRMSSLRESKLKQLLPRLARNRSPMSVRDFSAFIPCLQEADELP
ncbi:hypothetical protein Aperf_G00000076052 [Anoplocephala perfoliata]